MEDICSFLLCKKIQTFPFFRGGVPLFYHVTIPFYDVGVEPLFYDIGIPFFMSSLFYNFRTILPPFYQRGVTRRIKHYAVKSV